MYCILTLGMVTASVSIAQLPCSNFVKIDDAKVASLDSTFVPSKPQADIPLYDPKRTAIYNISARAVIMPNGEKLEAHSGYGRQMDDPQSVRLRAKGPTPPNHYRLSLRERLFHGVRAIRLNPVDRDKMFGRDGFLAHPYMLGPRGDSNGCVSLKDYDKFLKQYLAGNVTDIVVVKTADDIERHHASAALTLSK